MHSVCRMSGLKIAAQVVCCGSSFLSACILISFNISLKTHVHFLINSLKFVKHMPQNQKEDKHLPEFEFWEKVSRFDKRGTHPFSAIHNDFDNNKKTVCMCTTILYIFFTFHDRLKSACMLRDLSVYAWRRCEHILHRMQNLDVLLNSSLGAFANANSCCFY